jgi:multiple sugar transport system permease protein
VTELRTYPRPAPRHRQEPRTRGRKGEGAPRSRLARLAGRQLSPWLFLTPAMVAFGVFKFWPMARGVWMSLHRVRPYLGDQWIGFQNYHDAFLDHGLRAAVQHGVLDAVVTVVGSAVVGFGLALLLEGQAVHLRIFRTVAFLPVVTAMVVVAEVWGVLLYPGRNGPVNGFIGHAGLGPSPFLSGVHTSLPSMMFIQIWKSAPYDMLIFLAGLAGIDRQLYEAAAIDGAGRWQRLRYVTIPGLRYVTTIVITLGIIRGLRVFTEIWVTTGGGPAGSTDVIVTYIYRTGITTPGQIGYAAAVSTMLLIVTVILTCLFLVWRQRRALR